MLGYSESNGVRHRKLDEGMSPIRTEAHSLCHGTKRTDNDMCSVNLGVVEI